MNQREPLQEQSKIRSLLIQAELALKENRFEEALAMLSGISVEEMSTLNLEELQAIGALLNYLRELAEEKKNNLAEQLKVIQVGKNYLG
ncbi:hypothetical protein [Thermodesulfovibrio yellowstonii]|uniref:hypothetical protein n=1 Tax=Thermodesulfovibrio yellowstonii TaxID=28262 RepID=UPI00048CDEC7|nr:MULTISPECIES: hypothetical protein [Thermodesulfovibrio]MDI6865176.1 hypothetical protein [Thermodesulfovibrio yellowstonii]